MYNQCQWHKSVSDSLNKSVAQQTRTYKHLKMLTVEKYVQIFRSKLQYKDLSRRFNSTLKTQPSSSPFLFAPSEPAHVSDQGTLKTCTPESLAKCVVDGFEDEKFCETKLDFCQSKVTEKLTAMFPGQEKLVYLFI